MGLSLPFFPVDSLSESGNLMHFDCPFRVNSGIHMASTLKLEASSIYENSGTELILWDASSLLTVEVFLLTVHLVYLWWGNRK